MTEYMLLAGFIALLSLIPITASHVFARDRLLLQARLRDEEMASEEAQDMREHQRQRETDRQYVRELRDSNREYFRLERELEDRDEPWK